MAGGVKLTLVIFTVFCGLLVKCDEPCETAGCGLDTACYHKYNAETASLEAVCIPVHGFEQENFGQQMHLRKMCPPIMKIGIGGDRVDCGPNNHVPGCSEDSDCNALTHMCCYDGCNHNCRKFWLDSSPHH